MWPSDATSASYYDVYNYMSVICKLTRYKNNEYSEQLQEETTCLIHYIFQMYNITSAVWVESTWNMIYKLQLPTFNSS